MTQATVGARAPLSAVTAVDTTIDAASGVSWAAIIAGAFVASAFSLALVALGAGIGLISVSPWSSNNPSVTTFTVLAAAWFIAVQLFASGVGGYIAGRFRTRWARVHTDEVFFRDTAHGLVVWAVGAVISAALIASAATSAVSGAAHLAGAATQAVGTATGQAAGQAASAMGDPTGYFSDMLWRSDHPAQGDQAAATAEAGRILTRAVYNGDLPAARQDLSCSACCEPHGTEPARRGEARRRCLRPSAESQAAGCRQSQGSGRRGPQNRRRGRTLGFHLTSGGRLLSKLHGDRWRTPAGRSAAIRIGGVREIRSSSYAGRR